MSCNKGLGIVSALSLTVVTILLLTSGAMAQNSYKTLHKFNRGDSKKNGLQPIAGVILDALRAVSGRRDGIRLECGRRIRNGRLFDELLGEEPGRNPRNQE